MASGFIRLRSPSRSVRRVLLALALHWNLQIVHASHPRLAVRGGLVLNSASILLHAAILVVCICSHDRAGMHSVEAEQVSDEKQQTMVDK